MPKHHYTQAYLETLSTETLLRLLTGLSDVQALVEKADRDKVINFLIQYGSHINPLPGIQPKGL